MHRRTSHPIRFTRAVGALAIVVAALTAAACASTGAVPRPFPSPQAGSSAGSGGSQGAQGSEGARGSAGARVDRGAVVETALALRGTPYRNGGVDPKAGFDCSGFTQYVFSRYGVALPRDVRQQFEIGKRVKAAEIAPGDLIFFSTTARGASHVGIAVGRDQFVHAPNSTGVVRVERITAAYWSRRLVGARRVGAG